MVPFLFPGRGKEVTESNAAEEQCISGKDRLDGAEEQVKDVYKDF